MPNLGVEYRFMPHASACVALYHSSLDYFHRDLKFRTLTIMPELRYWTRTDGLGFFADAHAGIAWYNVAFGKRHRYQDHDGKTPAVGGGVSVGYRIPLRSPHWEMELSLGGGVYRLDYDVFRNETDGVMVDRRRRTFCGIDNAAVSVCYSFGGKEKGGAL